jgi:hypothetical protein
VSALRDAALDYAVRLGPVLPCESGGKQPLGELAPHGVLEASTDPDVIRRWWARSPDANVGIATGAPGPTVPDIDNMSVAGDVVARLYALGGPVVATARGLHFLCAGTDMRTTRLDFGELRGVGSYVVAPPSIHPTGKLYEWVVGSDRPLPAVPSWLLDGRESAGCGEQAPLVARVPYGGRHAHLTDAAVRLLRGGFTDEQLLARLLATVFEATCEPLPPPRADEFTDLAKWATQSRIAKREGELAERERELPTLADRWWVRS